MRLLSAQAGLRLEMLGGPWKHVNISLWTPESVDNTGCPGFQEGPVGPSRLLARVPSEDTASSGRENK